MALPHLLRTSQICFRHGERDTQSSRSSASNSLKHLKKPFILNAWCYDNADNVLVHVVSIPLTIVDDVHDDDDDVAMQWHAMTCNECNALQCNQNIVETVKKWDSNLARAPQLTVWLARGGLMASSLNYYHTHMRIGMQTSSAPGGGMTLEMRAGRGDDSWEPSETLSPSRSSYL
jgi:hypothetical protein